MAFMEPQATYEAFAIVDTNCGIENIPCELVGNNPSENDVRDYLEGNKIYDIKVTTGWFVRLSAPGYMDCTKWTGPFDTEDEAMGYLQDTHYDDSDETLDAHFDD